MVDFEIIREWVQKADDDFEFARVNIEELKEDCEYLTTFYVETRYPVHWPTRFSQEEAERAFHSARRIQSFIKNKIDLSIN